MQPARLSPLRIARLAIILLLAAIPPLLVLYDRWYGMQLALPWLRAWWCSIPLLCTSALRWYFVIIFACTLAVIVLVFSAEAEPVVEKKPAQGRRAAVSTARWQRQIGTGLIVASMVSALATAARLLQHGGLAGADYLLFCILYLVGWALRTTSGSGILSYARDNGYRLLSEIAGFVAICAVLFGYYSRHEITVASSVLAVTAALLLYWQRRSISPGYWWMLLATIVFAFRLNAWYFSYVGDEYSVLNYARLIALKSDLTTILRSVFDGTGVGEGYPYFASLLQAVSIRIFDSLNFGWRFSNILASALAVLCFFHFFRTFLPTWVASTGAFLIASSHYLASFSRIGYINSQGLLAMGLALASTSWAIRRRHPVAFVACALALALCLYTYPGAVYAIPLAIVLLLIYCPPWKENHWRGWTILTLSFMLFTIPLLLQPEYWAAKIVSTGYYVDVQTGLSPLQRVLTQLPYAFYSFLFLPHDSHYVSVALTDVVTAALVLIGLGAILRRLRADRFVLFTLVAFVILLLLVGSIHQYDLPPNTRMMLLVPWFALIAAIGLQWIARQLHAVRWPSWLAVGALSTLYLVILGLNFHQTYVVSVDPSRRNGSFEANFVKLAASLASRSDTSPGNILFVYDPTRHDIQMLKMLVELEYLPIGVRDLVVVPEQPAIDQARLLAADQVTLISPRLPDGVRGQYEAFFLQNQYLRCDVSTAMGHPVFEVWYPPQFSPPCGDPILPGPPTISIASLVLICGAAAALLYMSRSELARLGSSLLGMPPAVAAATKRWVRSMRAAARRRRRMIDAQAVESQRHVSPPSKAEGATGTAPARALGGIVRALHPVHLNSVALVVGVIFVCVGQILLISPEARSSSLGAAPSWQFVVLIVGGLIIGLSARARTPLLSCLDFAGAPEQASAAARSYRPLAVLLIVAVGLFAVAALAFYGERSLIVWLLTAGVVAVAFGQLQGVRLITPRPRPPATATSRWGFLRARLVARSGGAGFLWSQFMLCLVAILVVVVLFAQDATLPTAWVLHVFTILQFVAAILLVAPASRRDSRAAVRSLPQQVLRFLPVLLLLGAAAFLRLWQLNEFPFGFWFDEARDGLVARQMLADPAFRPVFIPESNQAAHFDYLIALSLSLFGSGTLAVRLVAAAFGIAAVVFAYLLFRRWFGPWIGFFAAGMLAVMRFHLTFSRWAIISITVPTFMLATLYFLDRAMTRKRLSDFGWFGLTVGFGLVFYRAFWLFAIVLAVFLLGLFVAGMVKHGVRQAFDRYVRAMAVHWILALLGVLVAAAPIAQLAVRRPDLIFARSNQVSIFTNRDEPNLGKALWSNTLKHVQMFAVRGDGNGRHNLPGEPMLDPLMGALFVVGIGCALWRWRDPQNALMLLVLPAMLLGGILALDFEAPQSNRAIGVIPAVVYFASLPVAVAAQTIARIPQGKKVAGIRITRRLWASRSTIWGAVLAGLLVVVAVLNLTTYFIRQRNDASAWVSYSTVETLAAREINANARNYDFVAPPGFVDALPGAFLVEPGANIQRWTVTDRLPLIRDNVDRGVILLFDAGLIASYHDAQRLYPSAQFIEHRPPKGGGTVLYEVILSPEVLRSAQGATAEYYAGETAAATPNKHESLRDLAVDWSVSEPLPEPFIAELRSTLVVQEYGQYRFFKRGSLQSALWIDEFPVDVGTATLARGNHSLRFEIQGGRGSIALLWQPPSSNQPQPVPPQNLFVAPVTNSGLLGSYYPTPDWSGPPAFTQIDPQIAYYFHIIPLPRPYSVRWTGKLFAPAAGAYEFEIYSVDGSRLTLDGNRVVDNPQGRVSVKNSTSLSEGWHDVSLDFSDRTSGTQIYLYWTPPGATRELIPSRYLLPPMGTYPSAP